MNAIRFCAMGARRRLAEVSPTPLESALRQSLRFRRCLALLLSLGSGGPNVRPTPTLCLQVGNSLPRRCHPTATTDLRKAVASLDPGIETCIVAMTDNGRTYDYPAEVRLEIGDQSIEDYAYAAGYC